jgi:predicted ATPase
VAALLSRCANLRIQATSREGLGVAGERVWRVEALPVPAATTSPAEAASSPSVQLFVGRAQAADARYALTLETVPAIVSICRAVEGIPLALELAAARTAVLGSDELRARVAHPLAVLTGGQRTAPTRQRTLRATFDWSYGLLDQSEQHLFASLSVFVGGWSLEAAEAVCGDRVSRPARPCPSGAARPESFPVLERLAALVHNLLVTLDRAETQPRYRFLEPIRQYAAERLRDQGRVEELLQRHAEYFLQLARAGVPASWRPPATRRLPTAT